MLSNFASDFNMRLYTEVMLFSEGFETSKDLSRKMVKLYKLSSEQLSQQDHYDFGMRALKSVLVMAGSLKRGAPDDDEQVRRHSTPNPKPLTFNP